MGRMTLSYTGELTTMTCWCGIAFALPSDLYRVYRSRGIEEVYCPLGHSMIPRDEGEVAKLQRALERERAASTHLADQRDAAERSARAHKGHVTRIKRRVANGVCPSCKRTFPNLAAHMHSKHPDYAGDGLSQALAALSEPSQGEPSRSPFRDVTDDLTGDCGCACHTGVGYNTSCAHCLASQGEPT